MAFENTAVEAGMMNASGAINQNVAARNAVSEQEMANSAAIANSAASNAAALHTKAIAQGEAYFEASAQAAKQAQYADKFRQASDMFASAYQERLNKQYDDNGNPTFRSLPSDIENIGADIASKIGGSIDDPEVANKFAQQFSGYVTQQKAQSYSTARNQELGYIKGNLAVSLQTYSDMAITGTSSDRLHAVSEMNQQIEAAVTTGALHPYEAQKLKEEFRGEIGKNVIRAAAEEDPYAAKAILDNPEQHGLYLNEAEKVKLGREVKQQIKIVDNQAKAEKAALRKEYNSAVKDLKARMTAGEQLDPKELDQFYAEAKDAGFEKEAEAFVAQANAVQEFTLLTPEERQTQLNKQAANSGQGELYQTLAKTDEKLNKERTEDPFGLGVRQKIVGSYALKPIDLAGDLDNQFKYRNAMAERIQGVYGGNVPPLMSQEIKALASQLPSMSAQDKAKLNAAISKNVPEDRALALFAELNKEGAGLDAFSGGLAATGRTLEANRVQTGMDLQKQKLFVIPESIRTAEMSRTSSPMRIPFGDPKTQKEVHDAIWATYVTMAHDQGKDPAASIDSDLMNKAAQSAVGNTVDSPIGSGTLVLPKDVSKLDFNLWATTDLSSYFKDAEVRLGDAKIPAEQIASAFQDKGRLVQRDYNSYYAYMPRVDGTMAPVLDSNGKPVILTYNAELAAKRKAGSYINTSVAENLGMSPSAIRSGTLK